MFSPSSVLSLLLGWTSTIAWSISFYPQALLNYRRKSVTGLSFDFVVLNVEGFLAYSIYNSALFSNEAIRREYRHRNGGHQPSVRGNDVAFAIHALILSVITLCQIFVYKRDEHQRISTSARIFITATVAVVAICAIVAKTGHLPWLDLLYYLSYLKLTISFVKLVPQAWMNYKRKSTIGWSIHNILLDLTGGVCSLAQLLLDASIQDDWGSLRGNPAKLILGIIAISFDLIFLVQHYVLYREREQDQQNTRVDAGDTADLQAASDVVAANERTRLVA